MLAMRIEQRHGQGRRTVIRHDFDEFAGRNMILHVIGRDLDQAEAGQAAGDVGLGAVDRDAPANRPGSRDAGLDPFPFLDAPRRGRRIVDGEMRVEPGRRMRFAISFEIGRTGRVDQRQIADRAGRREGIPEAPAR